MMATSQDKKEVGEKIGAAWALLRQNKPADALREFERIVSANPAQIDGLYGMGLAQAVSRQYDQAIKSFESCRLLVVRELEKNPGSGRFEIMERMCIQRVADIRRVSAHG